MKNSIKLTLTEKILKIDEGGIANENFLGEYNQSLFWFFESFLG